MLPEKSFDTSELTLNYAEGPASGPPLLLLHGLTGRWQNFQPLIPHLTATWHIYACDLRGHGKSGRSADHYHLTDYVRDSVAFLREQITTPTFVLGHSLGALAALGSAAYLPEQIRGLVLLDPPLFFRNLSIEVMPGFMSWFRWVHATTAGAQSYAEVLARCQEKAPPDADEIAIRNVADTLFCIAPETVGIVLRDQLLEGFNLGHALRNVACQTLLVYGEPNLGSCVRDSDAEFFQANVRHSKVIQIKEAGHDIHSEQPVTVFDFMTQIFNTL